MSVEQYTVSEPWIKSNCKLGESPLGIDESNTLYFLDVIKKRIHAVDVVKGPESLRLVAQLDFSVSVLTRVKGHSDLLAFGGKLGFGLLNVHSGKTRWIKKMWSGEEGHVQSRKEHEIRMNDGSIDTRGRFWCSAINDPLVRAFAPDGTLFRLDSDLTLHRVREGVNVGNGISWTADDKVMYWTDSAYSTIFAFDYDADTATMSNERVFFRYADDEDPNTGTPDGHAVDEHGNLWVAIAYGSKVVRLSPQGKITAEIHLPMRMPTACAFVGTDLYITSIAEEQPEKYPESAKAGGHVFKCPVGVRGRPTNQFVLPEEEVAKL